LGSGHTTRLFQKLGAKVSAVETENEIVKMNEKHFNTKPDSVETDYARSWIESHAEDNDVRINPLAKLGQSQSIAAQFDVIVHDAFANGDKPIDSLTRHAIKSLASALSDDGILILVRTLKLLANCDLTNAMT